MTADLLDLHGNFGEDDKHWVLAALLTTTVNKPQTLTKQGMCQMPMGIY